MYGFDRPSQENATKAVGGHCRPRTPGSRIDSSGCTLLVGHELRTAIQYRRMCEAQRRQQGGIPVFVTMYASVSYMGYTMLVTSHPVRFGLAVEQFVHMQAMPVLPITNHSIIYGPPNS